MKSLLLLYVHVTIFSVYCLRRSGAASSITCEAVSPESSAKPSCYPVGDCIDVDTPSGSSEPGVNCLEDKLCPSSKPSDGEAVKYNSTNKEYSIDGLPRFNGSHIGYCPSAHNGSWLSGNCTAGRDINYPYTRVTSLTIDYRPVNARIYKAKVKWSYHIPLPDQVKALKLYVYGPGIEFPGYCLCIERNLSFTEYSLLLRYNGSAQQRATVQMVMFPIPKNVNPERLPRREISRRFPENCSDYGSGLQHSTSSCGVPQYGRPRNVQVNKSGASTTLSWDKPCLIDSNACQLIGMDVSKPDTYYLTTTVNNITTNFVVYNSTEVTLSTADPINFKLYSCSGLCEVASFPNGCSQPATSPGELDNQTCCMSDSLTTSTSVQVTMTPTPTLRGSPSTSSPMIYVIAPVSIVALALIVVIVILASLFCFKCNPTGRPKDERLIELSDAPTPVLVVYSPRTSEQEARTILQYLVRDLTESPYCIESSTYGIGQLRQSLSEWMVERHREAKAVLCVCNREFSEDWTETCADINSSPQVVRTLKNLFEGDLQRTPSSTKNYAVITMTATDKHLIPPLLKSRESYMYHEVDNIARFCCNMPKYHIEPA